MRSVTVQTLDNYGGIAESVDRQSCYMMRVDEMYAEVSNDPSGKPPSTGLFVGCFVDVSTGVVSFTCEGKEIRQDPDYFALVSSGSCKLRQAHHPSVPSAS